jgi:hypothetical protein
VPVAALIAGSQHASAKLPYLPVVHTVLVDSVRHILTLRSHTKVVEPETRWVIAQVHHNLVTLQRPDDLLHHPAMDALVFPHTILVRKHRVAVAVLQTTAIFPARRVNSHHWSTFLAPGHGVPAPKLVSQDGSSTPRHR